MITVAIVAILASVAYPSYTAYVQRGRIADVTGLMVQTRVRMEQFYQDNRNYGTAAACGVVMPSATPFTLTCATGNSEQTFVITAAGSGLMANFAFTVNDANVQRTTAFPGASGLPANCWMQRKGQTC